MVPKLLGTDGLASLALTLVSLIEFVKLGSVNFRESTSLVGAKKGPFSVLLHTLHEKVRNPECDEKVAGSDLLLTVVLTDLHEVKDIRVPRLKVHAERSLALATTLVDVASSVVEDTEHRNDAVGVAVGACNIAAGGTNLVNVHTNTSCVLGDSGAGLECLEDTLDGVLLHVDKEAARHLGTRSTSVEECGRGVGEELLRHELVCLNGTVDVILVDANGHTHEHVLRALSDLTVKAQKVGPFEGLEAEKVVLEVAVVVDGSVDAVLVSHDNVVDVFSNERGIFAIAGVDVVAELGDCLGERFASALVEVAHSNACSEDAEVRVLRCGVSGGLGCELIKLSSGNAGVHALDYLLGNLDRVAVLAVQAVAEFADTLGDLVKLDLLLLAVALDNVHGAAVLIGGGHLE
mmetsp:Transcript_19727/g.38612  ORF Transcript_19727/g.38612 Transcript_19727/m.38612 type:complete len:405 (-) Transcript_19727:253-1467(-)